MSQKGLKRRCWFLTPYLHWREEAPYWKRHCSSASYTCPGATVGYRKSRFKGSLSRHVPRPELSKKQTYNSIVSCNNKNLCSLAWSAGLDWKRMPATHHYIPQQQSFQHNTANINVLGGRCIAVKFNINTFQLKEETLRTNPKTFHWRQRQPIRTS